MASRRQWPAFTSSITHLSVDGELLSHEYSTGVAGSFQVMDSNLHVEVVIGDILTESTSVIVNSIGPFLNFDKAGHVAKSIKQKAGASVLQECEAIGKPIDCVAVTEAGKLPVKYIFHVASRPSEWTKSVEKVLNKADEMNLASVSFPALGTGKQKINSGEMADIFVKAFERHVTQHRSSHVKLVRIVIYKTAMVKSFLDVLEKMSKGKYTHPTKA